MYLRYYGFNDFPFSVTPDPAFLYLSGSHREALGHLLYGTGEHGGFVALIGEVGTGKTTLIRALVDNDTPEVDIALCWNPHLEVREFVATICDELGAAYDPATDTSLKDMVDRLNRHLLASHADNRRTVLIIDEAQNLSSGVLEQLRLLTNLETHKHKLLRIILVGQPELADLLGRHDLRQLAQRITARFWLKPLDRTETRAYVQHRLKLAGGSQHLFSPLSLTYLKYATGGIPRLINMVCERALMGGYAHARSRIGLGMLRRAAIETLPGWRRTRWARLAVPVIAVLALAAVGAVLWVPGIELSRAAEWIQQSSGARTQSDSSGATADSTPKETPVSAADDTASTEEAAGTPVAEAEVVSDGDGQATSDKSQAIEGDIPAGNADINQLLRLWGVFGSQVRTSCPALRVGDLRCLAERGSFSVLERFNRPALLTIEREGARQKVLLSSLNDDSATLVGADGTRRVARGELARLWTGEFEVIWRSDSGVSLIQPGAVGDAVVWLRRRLAKVRGRNLDKELGPPSPIYDDRLAGELRAFQRASGLDADGMAGPRTQMMLNGAVPSPGSPALEPVEE